MMIPRGGYSTGYGTRRPYNPNRPQLSVRRRRGPVDETIYPKSDLSVVDGSVLEFRIHIPGFVKEEVKIKKFESLGYISVEGEKKRTDNSRLLFNTIQTIPGEYNMSQATTELDRGILTIRIPKKETLESEASTSRKIPGPEKGTTAKPDMLKIKEGTLGTLKTPVGSDEETQEKVAGVKISPRKVETPEKLAQQKFLEDGNGEKNKASSKREGGKLDNKGMEKEGTDQRGVIHGREEKKREGDFADTKEKNGEDIISKRANSSMAAKEQKELLINICVGVSVIVALGGHIVYKFTRN